MKSVKLWLYYILKGQKMTLKATYRGRLILETSNNSILVPQTNTYYPRNQITTIKKWVDDEASTTTVTSTSIFPLLFQRNLLPMKWFMM